MIIISPYSSKLHTGIVNPKTFDKWLDVVAQLNFEGETVHQIGTMDEAQVPGIKTFYRGLELAVIKELVLLADAWASVDNFLPHLMHGENRPGVVVFSQSDPAIFGYPENINLLKDSQLLRPDQFNKWSEATFKPEAFVSARDVSRSLLDLARRRRI